jgi:WD40 repeat protein
MKLRPHGKAGRRIGAGTIHGAPAGMEGKMTGLIETGAMPRRARSFAPILAAVLAVLPACAGRIARAPEPPPTGPFRTASGAATHPRCMPPKRPGPDGSAPRCVVSFGRGTTAMTASPDGAVALITLLDVDATAWTLPDLAYAHGFDPIPEEAGEAAHGGEKEGPQALLVAPDSRSALFAVEDRLVRYDLASGKVLGEFEGAEGRGMVDNVAWSPDGRRVLLTSAGDGKARLADVAAGRILRTFAVEGRVVKMAFAPDGHSAALGTEVGTVAIVDLEAAGRKPRVLTPSTQEITGLAHLDATLVVAARDGKLRLFDREGKKLAEAATGGPITRFALAPKDGLAAVADADNVVRVFTVPGLAEHARYAWHQASITALAWGAGPTLLAADNDGELAAWPVPAPR